MRLWSLAFLLGVLTLQQFSYLPNYLWLLLIVLSMIFIHIKFNRYGKLFSGFYIGFLWVFLYATVILSWNIAENMEGKSILIEGEIASIPENATFGSTFLFSTKKIANENRNTKIKLSWQKPDIQLHVGDQWRLTVKLKKVHGLMNLGGFDYEAWALQDGIRAMGYVVSNAQNTLLQSHWYHSPLNRFRQLIKEKIENNLPKTNTSPWIAALAVGERNNISQENWQILRNTGTNHLMAIAGLHIGLMASFVFFMTSWCWRRAPQLVLKMPAQHAGAIAALLMTLIYSALAGFSIPTQRACFMLSVFLIILFFRRKMAAWNAWSIALIGVLILNPLCVLTESVWLSFGSVALIIYGVGGRLSLSGLWWKWGRVQWVIAFGLIPLSIWLFQQFSLISFVANAIAIPCVGFLIVPLTLLGTFSLFFSVKMSIFILSFADKLLSIVWIILTYLSKLEWAVWYQFIPSHWIIAFAVIGIVLLLLPAGFYGRWFGIFWLLPAVFFKPDTVKNGDIKLTLLDVGQGLSAVIQTAKHVLVFDAGSKLGSQFDIGESVVIPFLKANAIKKLDMLVISHGDNDHFGGAKSVSQYFSIPNIKTSVPEKFTWSHADFCLRGDSWNWDGVHFEFLYPSSDNLKLDNNSSCVLRISNQFHAILLTGDIEKLAEENLHQMSAHHLSADVLVAPHHGSKTSANMDFLNDVHPKMVLYSIGYRNRYHFPHVSVVQKYQKLNVSQYDTVQLGAIQILLSDSRKEIFPQFYRQNHHRYWHHF